jgi:hypothetical protein
MLQHINFRSARTLPLQNYMKPLSQISRQLTSLGDEQAPTGSQVKYPVTDCHYHAAGADLRAANDRSKLSPPLLAPSFRDLSSEFLAVETKRTYVAEALFFAVIVGISAWPIVAMVQALSHLVK